MILWIGAILLICLGFLGCFVNKVPGPLLAFIGILLPVLFGDVNAEVWMLCLIGVLVVVSMIISSKVLPKLGEKIHPFGKAGSWGTTLGSILGLLSTVASSGSPIFGMLLAFVILPYGSAFLFELISQNFDVRVVFFYGVVFDLIFQLFLLFFKF